MTSGAKAAAAHNLRIQRGYRHLLCGVSVGVLALASLPAAAQDATRYWDANGALPGSGGSGNWNTTSQLWSESNSDVLGLYYPWNNAGLDNAIFGVTAAGTTTTAGTVTLTQPITVHNMTFQRVNGWILSGGVLTLAGVAPTIDTATTATINSVLAGTAGLVKSGASTLALTGTNTFSGGITLSGGSLTADDDAALGALSNAINVTVNSNLNIGGAPTGRTVDIASGATLVVGGSGAGGALYTGGGNLNSRTGVRYTNDFSTYTGSTIFRGDNGCVCQTFFSSVRNLGEASSLGAPTDATAGTIIFNQQSQYSDNIVYTGDGDTSNRNWDFNGNSAWLNNDGTGALNLTGDMDILTGGGVRAIGGDIDLGGVLSGGAFNFNASAGRKITLSGVANTFAGAAGIGGLVEAASLANAGAASSIGQGSTIALVAGTLSYTGAAATSDRTWTASGVNMLHNDGTGVLTLGGDLSFVAGGAADSLTFGGSFSGENTFSGVISGAGNVISDGAGTWVLGGANTYAGATTVTSGTLRAGSASAFGATGRITVNGGVLDLNDFNLSATELHGTGGSIALGTNPLTTLTVDGTSASDYAGVVSGAGGLTKLGASTLTLTGANTYTGATTIGGGTLALNFASAGAPSNNIIAAGSALNLSGGKLQVTSAVGVTNEQTFASTTVSAGANTILAESAAGGTVNLDLGAISRTSGLVNFVLPTSGSITTSNSSLGGWATVNGTDYAKVVGGEILPFAETDYTDKDEVATWLAGEFISDSDGDGDSFSGTLVGSMQLGGLQFTEAATSNVTVGGGETLGVDGAIIVASSVSTNTQTISGGALRGAAGGVLGMQHNGGGLFTIASTVVDNGGPTGFTKGGTGAARLTGANTYTGVTTLSAGRLEITSLADGGAASSIGQSSSASANLVLQGGTLAWAGAADATTNRGFTLVNGGAGDPKIEVGAVRTVEFSGLVTSPDDAGLTKTGAGTLLLSNAANDYVGVTRISGGGALAVSTLADGGQVSGIGRSSADSSNLVLETDGELRYTGATDSTDRGFTLISGGKIGVAQAATTLTVSGVGVGAGPLIKEGDGTLVLSGLNTYGGGTTVNGGALIAGSNQAFGGAANGTGVGRLTVNAPASVDIGDFDVWVAGLQGDGNVTIGASGTLQTRAGAEFTGAISGAGGVLVGAFTQIMTGCNNTYAGPTTIAGGTLSTNCLADGLQASGIGASGAASTNLVIDNGALAYTGGDVSIDRGAQLLRTAQINVSDALTTLELKGAITGTGLLNKQGAGTLVLSGANDYAGGTNVYGGTLRVLSASGLGTGGVRMGLAGTKLDLTAVAGSAVSVAWIDDSANNADAASVGDIDLGATTLTITPGGGAWGVGGAGNYAGVISGTGGIIKSGASIQQFSACNNTYTGATAINGGVLAVDCLVDGSAASSLGASTEDAANLILNGGTLRYVGTGHTTNRLFTLGASTASAIDASGAGAVVFSNTAPIAFSSPNTAQTVTLTGVSTADNKLGLQLTDNGTGKTGLSKTGAGTWILTNPGSTYTGVTSITGGVLGVDKLTDGGLASSLGQSSDLASNLMIGSGATLRYTGAGDTTNRRFTLGVGTTAIESSGSGAVVFSNTAAVSYSGNGLRVVSLGGANADDNIMGAAIGNQTATNVSSLAKIGAGKWILTGDNAYTGVTNLQQGTLVLGAGGTTGSIASQTVNNFGALGFDRSDTLTYGGVISQIGSVEQLGAGKTTLTGTNTYTGGTTISAGTLELGSGGATGSIVGNVANDGLFIFNRNNTYAFTGLVSGSGELRQVGSGATVLSANNSYGGATNVMAGTLRINGDQSAATGLTTVFSGATLGGTGVIGGDVLVQNGGAISPGNSPGTLTINGDLALNSSSVLNMEFGQANVPGGALNDLIVVNGDLTLDGVINVTVPTGGVFTAGVYRVIDYTGALDNQTLTVGTLPSGASATVQTSVAGQVNLVNTAGQTLYFWDGPTGGKNDSVITGGTGTWRLGGAANDWTNSAGSVNSDFAPDAFAVFQGAAGTVTVDGAGGAVGVSGVQFAVDGYTVTGAGLTLAADQTPIRVGDLTPASAGMTATINSVLSGAGQLVKVDGGTLVLGGTNTYTGGTLVNEGVLSISNDANLGAAAGDLTFDGGTLRLTSGVTLARAVTLEAGGGTIRTDAVSSVSGDITGGGGLTKTGTSVLTLTGTNTYSGGTTISDGALALGNGPASGSIVGDVLNNGQLTFANPGAYTFAGEISGSGNVRKTGAGVQTLTGANSYAGTTTVAAGTLLINGDQSLATGLTTVSAGTLGGSGTIGGDVTVAAGASLAPGGTAGAPGTLSINGDLTLTDAATSLNYEFGQANLPGGTFNDLAKVGGDVSLGGATINVASSAPSFGPGLYRVIDYAGTRTGTLTLGAQPAGASFSVQTSVDKQVNLVNTAGLTLNVWDGDAGGRNDSDIAGGTGFWQGGAGGNDNWTLADGSFNAPFADNAFAIFTTTGGVVTVDATTAGPINISGMQFAVTGYELSGDTINLTAPESNIWVGDGTSNSATIAALINANLGGAGGLVKTDAGTLLLNGNNTYAGETKVDGGTLVIGGDQSGAIGATFVNSGGVLQGNGIVGGDVTVSAGGTLAPGFPYGQLTINGDLILTTDAILAMDLGQAGAPGGALNDLIVVGGDLTLDGTLDVTESVGGVFGPGIYRLIDYTGALTDNTLDIGTLPSDYATVQTSIAQQVNLVVSATPPGGGPGPGPGPDPGGPPTEPPASSYNFWDGDQGAANDSTIDGGDGIWRASPANWTTSTGAANGAFTPASFAIFAAEAGAVTVDDSEGDVRVSGMQFASDGYHLIGDAISLEGGEAIVRVGDGTVAGGAFTATIGSTLTGAGQLHKTDAGTLVLTGDSDYAGGTRISGGTLQLGDGGEGGSIRGDVRNDGRLAFNRADDLAFAGVISGGGVIAQIGSGVTALSGDSSAFSGRTEVREGTLAVDGKLGGAVEVFSGGRLTGHGQVGSLLNQAGGIVAPGGFGALTVAGGYEGRGGTLQIETVLGGDDSQTGRLLVRGATSGSTLVEVANRGGLGGLTSNGILVVDVDGASEGVFTLAKGDFRLGGENALVAGAYAYVLRKDAQGGDWKLRSGVNEVAGPPRPADPDQPAGEPGAPVDPGLPQVTLYQPGAPVYEAYAHTLQTLNGLSTMRQRVGARQWSGEDGAGVWGRMEGGRVKIEPAASTTNAKLETDRWKVQFGVDQALVDDLAGGRLVGGLTAHYGEASTSVGSPFGGGSLEAKALGLGATLTWADAQGAYVDAQAQASWFETDLRSSILGDRAEDADGSGYAFSVEAGKTMAAAQTFSLTPQVQLTYSKVDFDSFVDPLGAKVAADEGESLLARVGIALDRDWTVTNSGGEGRVYGLVNFTHELLDGSRVDVSGTPLVNRAERTWGGIAVGATYGWGAGRYLVYGETAADTPLSGFGDSYAVSGTVGVRMRF
jgi:fibronectin-binding autotransporter adhesin